MTTVKIPEGTKRLRAEARKSDADRTLKQAQRRSRARRESAYKLALLRQIRHASSTDE